MSADRPPEAAEPGAATFQVHRLTTGRVVAWAVVIAGVWVLVDAAQRRALGSSTAALLGMLALCLVAYVLGLRPAVVEGLQGVEVRNPLRTTSVPWGSVADADVTDVLRLHAGGRVVRCFAVPRRRPPITRRGASAQTYGFSLPAAEPAGPGTPRAGVSRAQALAERLLQLARQYHGTGGGEPVARVAPDAVVALATAVVAGLVAVAVVVL